MRSFRFKTRRTKKYTSEGQQINSTFNTTSRHSQYKNTNPRFDSRSNDRDRIKGAGCGKECCLMSFLLTDISGGLWNTSLNYGHAFAKGTKVYAGSVAPRALVGTIDAAVYPYTNCCITPGRPSSDYDVTENTEKSSDEQLKCHASSDGNTSVFPITVRILLTPATGSCNQRRWQSSMSLYFGTPTASPHIGPAHIQRETPVKMGLSRIGKPYRNPIGGYRKTLVCCDPAQNNYSQCVWIFEVLDWNGSSKPNIADEVRDMMGRRIGDVVDAQDFGSSGAFTVRSNLALTKINQYYRLQIGTNQYYTRLSTKIENNSCLKHFGPTNDIYKDNIAKSGQWDTRACYNPRIRSGMQPKPSVRIIYKSTNNSYKKCTKQLCPNDKDFAKPYNYSYAQYLHNGSNKSFARSQEKYLPHPFDVSSNCPKAGQCRSGAACCQASQYRKSGGNACARCVGTATQSPSVRGANNITIYKPNNKKFQAQGAVSSGSRLERLKLDVIRESNSKCPKGGCKGTDVGGRCKQVGNEKYGKGPYFAGQPRFTGWMYNACHPETTCARRYHPQPFGIPQLTNKRRATRSNRMANVNPKTSGVSGVFQRTSGNPPQAPGSRVPGCKCSFQTCKKACADGVVRNAVRIQM